jgi:hypothetical protein
VPSGQDERDPLGMDVTGACRERLARFRWEFYRSLTRWSGALFELCDAVLCAPGPVTSLPELSLAGVHRRGHGRMDVDRLRRARPGCRCPVAETGRSGWRWT